MMKVIVVTLILSCLIVGAFSSTGFDLDVVASQAAFTCLKQQGHTFTVLRGYYPGNVDPAAAANAALATSVGLSVDIYVQPCANQTKTCTSGAAGQLTELLSYLKTNNVKYSYIWLSVQNLGDVWGSNQLLNRLFWEDYNTAALKPGVKLGVLTSLAQWNAIMGASYTNTSGYPLWYVSNDGQQTFADFKPFGGWKAPYSKQYQSLSTICNTRVNLDWYPNSTTTTSSGSASTTAHAASTSTTAASTASAATTHSASTSAHIATTTDHAATTTAHAATATTHATTNNNNGNNGNNGNNNNHNTQSTYGLVEPGRRLEKDGGQGWSAKGDYVKGKKVPIVISKTKNLANMDNDVDDEPVEDLQVWEGKPVKKFAKSQ